MTFSTIGIALLLGMQLFQIVDKLIDKLSSSECTNKGMRVEMKHKLEQELAPHESHESQLSRESSREEKKKKKKYHHGPAESEIETIEVDTSEEEAHQDQTDYDNNYTEEEAQTESL